MQLKKIFFPIGGGEELAERIHGALLVNKFFGTHINIMACQLDPKMIYNVRMTLKGGVLMEEFLKSAGDEMQAEREDIRAIFDTECAKLGLDQNDDDHVPNSAALRHMVGIRSELVEKYSKYCDLVLVSVPPMGSITGTFEAAVTKSGKPCIVIPRKLKEFRADKILVSLTGTAASARALDNWLELLQRAKSITVITANHYLQDDVSETKRRISDYLALHGIKINVFEALNVEGKIPGQVLLEYADASDFDLIVAGLHSDSGIKEIFLGGASKYFLQKTKIPVLM